MLRRALNFVFLRYIAASAVALGVDLGTFLVLLSFGLEAAIAAAAGYALGIITHWFISSRAVFIGGVAQRGPDRNRQKALFIGSALAGLALTTAIVGLGTGLGLDPRLAKLAAIAVSFTCNWLLRERVVFKLVQSP